MRLKGHGQRPHDDQSSHCQSRSATWACCLLGGETEDGYLRGNGLEGLQRRSRLTRASLVSVQVKYLELQVRGLRLFEPVGGVDVGAVDERVRLGEVPGGH